MKTVFVRRVNFPAITGVVLSLLAAPGAYGNSPATEDAFALAEHCCDLAGVRSGVCSILGCDEGTFPLAMAQAGGFFVHAQDARPDAVAAARAHVDRARMYGKGIVVEQGDLGRLPYARGTVDLIVAIGLSTDQLGQMSVAEMLRALRPEGKVIIGYPKGSADGQGNMTAEQLAARLEQAKLTPAKITPASVVEDSLGVWAILTKPPLVGADAWTHWEHGPDNNPVSTDTVIQAPYMTQWLGLPYYIAMPAISVSSGGRLFIAMGHIAHHRREEPWLNTILARNAYNGAILWKKRLPDGYLVHRSAFIATDDTFYMIDPGGSGLLMLDPETGDEKGKVVIPELRRGEWKWIAMQDGVLYVLAGGKEGPAETTVVRSQYTHWSWGELSKGYYTKRVPWGFGTTLAAYDTEGKKLRWIHRANAEIDSRAMAIGNNRVYFYGPDLHAGCLDAATGEAVWTNEDSQLRQLIEEPGRGLGSTPGFRSACFCLFTPDALIYEAQTRMNVVAVSTHDGRMLWQRRKTTNNPNIIFADDRIYAGVGEDGNTLALDPQTGDTLEDLGFKKRSCARLTATPDSFFCRGWPEGLTRYDRKTGKVLFNGAFRPSCNDGVLPANGMLYIGPWACDCNLSVMGRVALCSASSFRPDAKAAESRRFEAGPGDVAEVAPLGVSAEDWPTYRANSSRSAASAATVSGPLSGIWQFRPQTENRPTAPTAAGGLVFFGGDDGKVRALDAGTGKLKWSYLTAGPIAQPPTIAAGRAYVGSGDGYVYALEAATGRLLWRLRVAPVDRRIMVYGSLCSTWPVNSGVLVDEGVAYAAAGIVDYDGTYVCALDAATGELKWLNDSSGHLDPDLRKGVSAQGTLTIAGGRLWMAGGNVVSPVAFDLETGQYLSEAIEDGSPRANRGEEVAAFLDRFVVLGGRLRYSAVRNVVNPGSFAAYSIRPNGKLRNSVQINSGKIAPAWDSRMVASVNGRDAPPTAHRLDKMEQFLDAGDSKKRPSPEWTTEELRGSDTVSIAIAKDAIVAVCSTPRPRNLRPSWRLCSIDRRNGNLASQEELPAEALPGGLLVDRDGRIIVVLQDGSVHSFGSSKSLAASVQAVTTLASQGPQERRESVQFLRRALATNQSSEGHAMLLAKLADLGVRVTDKAAQNGYITGWHLFGHVPWDDADNPVDKVFVGEPNVDVSSPRRIENRTLPWREFVTVDPHGMVDLAKLMGPKAEVAAYGYAEVVLPEAREIVLRIGSNDGFKCWFNGHEVSRFDGGRGYFPDQDSATVQAEAGVNKVLMKVTQMGGAWAFSVRMTDPSGKPIDLARKE